MINDWGHGWYDGRLVINEKKKPTDEYNVMGLGSFRGAPVWWWINFKQRFYSDKCETHTRDPRFPRCSTKLHWWGRRKAALTKLRTSFLCTLRGKQACVREWKHKASHLTRASFFKIVQDQAITRTALSVPGSCLSLASGADRLEALCSIDLLSTVV